MKQVYTLRTTSGEFIIGEVTEETENMVFLKTPMLMVPQIQGQNIVFSLVPYYPVFKLVGGQQHVPFMNSSLMNFGPSEDNLTQKYIEATSDIILPRASKIILNEG